MLVRLLARARRRLERLAFIFHFRYARSMASMISMLRASDCRADFSALFAFTDFFIKFRRAEPKEHLGRASCRRAPPYELHAWRVVRRDVPHPWDSAWFRARAMAVTSSGRACFHRRFAHHGRPPPARSVESPASQALRHANGFLQRLHTEPTPRFWNGTSQSPSIFSAYVLSDPLQVVLGRITPGMFQAVYELPPAG